MRAIRRAFCLWSEGKKNKEKEKEKNNEKRKRKGEMVRKEKAGLLNGL